MEREMSHKEGKRERVSKGWYSTTHVQYSSCHGSQFVRAPCTGCSVRGVAGVGMHCHGVHTCPVEEDRIYARSHTPPSDGGTPHTWWLVLRLSICLLKASNQNCLHMKTTASSSFLNLGVSREALSTKLSPTRCPRHSSC